MPNLPGVTVAKRAPNAVVVAARRTTFLRCAVNRTARRRSGGALARHRRCRARRGSVRASRRALARRRLSQSACLCGISRIRLRSIIEPSSSPVRSRPPRSRSAARAAAAGSVLLTTHGRRRRRRPNQRFRRNHSDSPLIMVASPTSNARRMACIAWSAAMFFVSARQRLRSAWVVSSGGRKKMNSSHVLNRSASIPK